MSFVRNAFQTMHPLAQLVMLGCIVLTFMALAAGAGVLWVAGGDAAAMQSLMQRGATGQLDRAAVLAMNNANQLMAFLGGSFAFAALVGRQYLGRFFLKLPAWNMLGLAVAIALGMSPVLDLTYRINEWALVPGSELHAWAGGLEAQAMLLTKAILSFTQDADVWAVLLSVAVLPAICEEWLFRGTVQPIVVRATGNMHVGIWVSAVLFSAIHMQFFGFVPRMLLGAGFGYLVAYSGSLWPAILGHFVNNAGVVLAAFWMGEEWIENGLEPQALSTWEWTDWAWASIALLALAWSLRSLFHWGNTDSYLEAFSPETKQHAQTPLQS